MMMMVVVVMDGVGVDGMSGMREWAGMRRDGMGVLDSVCDVRCAVCGGLKWGGVGWEERLGWDGMGVRGVGLN